MKTQWAARGKEVLGIEIEGLQSVRERLGGAFDRAVAMLAACTGRVVVTGIGKSGLVGRKIAATLSSTGTPAFFLHPVEGAHGDLGTVRAEDVILAISYSGQSDELNAILPALRSLGPGIIAITAGLASPMAAMADVVLDSTVPREACPMNLAPTTSTTAALALGDALAVCLIDLKSFTPKDFKRFHPGGALGRRLSLAVADIMHTTGIPLTREDAPLKEALAVLDQGKLGAVLAMAPAGRLSGILTDGDVRRLVCRGLLEMNAPLSAVMTKNPRHALPGNNAAEVIDIMEQKMITVLPVLDEEQRLLGVVHMHDLLGKGQVKIAE